MNFSLTLKIYFLSKRWGGGGGGGGGSTPPPGKSLVAIGLLRISAILKKGQLKTMLTEIKCSSSFAPAKFI